VKIGDNVFIGAHSTILKGVTIGESSVVGECSVVAKDIPENDIWAVNPAVFIRNGISRDVAFKRQDGEL
jgi:acetyltransferase-like isoleucine patch superfamily enzyme